MWFGFRLVLVAHLFASASVLIVLGFMLQNKFFINSETFLCPSSIECTHFFVCVSVRPLRWHCPRTVPLSQSHYLPLAWVQPTGPVTGNPSRTSFVTSLEKESDLTSHHIQLPITAAHPGSLGSSTWTSFRKEFPFPLNLSDHEEWQQRRNCSVFLPPFE